MLIKKYLVSGTVTTTVDNTKTREVENETPDISGLVKRRIITL